MSENLPNPSQLFNDGYMCLFPQERNPEDKSTILVVGQARAGTTMVGLALREMGIHVGERIGPVHEDNELGAFVPQLQAGVLPQGFVCAVEDRNDTYPTWAWKRPDLYVCLGMVTPELRNPHVVCILRDPVALASRNCISLPNSEESESKAIDLLALAMDEQKAILDAILLAKLPTLLLSYEKALSRTDEFLGALARFVGKELNKEEQARLSRLVMPNHLGYALRARALEYEGDFGCRGVIIDGKDGFLLGKVAPSSKADKSVVVEAWVDGLRWEEGEVHFEEGGKEWTTIRFDVGGKLVKDSHVLQLTFASDGRNFANSPFIWIRED